MSQIPGQLEAILASRYVIEGELGTGATATVYLAHDLRHDRKVAIKVLRPELAAVLGADRFLNEIRVSARLNHPGIVPLFDSGEAEGQLYYVMPAIEGETLRQKLDREKQLGIEEAITIATAIGNALAYAHEHNVVHRDIKPENILLHRGVAQIADFGIAAAIDRADHERITATGISIGTPNYFSPEQATGDRAIGPRSDIYALGVVLYEMLAGDPPFTGSNTMGVIARILHEKPTSVRRIRQTASPEVEAALDRALAKVPADRYATASGFVAALRGADRTLHGTQAADSADVAPPTLATPLRFLAELNRRRVVRAAVWFAGAAFALLEATPTILGAFDISGARADRITKFEVIAVLATFPIVVGLAWIFEFTNDGKLRREGAPKARRESRTNWAISAGAIVIILMGTAALAAGTWRAMSGTALEPQRYAIMPLHRDGGAGAAADEDVLFHDAFLPWRGIDVEGLVTGAHDKRDERDIAFSAKAGRLVRGSITNVGSMRRLNVALHDTRTDRILADTTVTYAAVGANTSGILKDIATWLLFRGAGVRSVDVRTPMGSASYDAALSFLRGQQALDEWSVDSAVARFDAALSLDASFTRAALWHAQSQNWNGVDAAAAELRPVIERLSASNTTLSPRERLLADGIVNLAARSFGPACAAYAAVVAADSQDFAGWYGLGECRMRDKLVIRNPRSPSGWSFRSSYQAALNAYRRAFLALTERRDFRSRTVENVRRFSYTSSNHYRDGYALQPSRIDFRARPELVNDTIAFTPYPRADFAAGRAAPRWDANAAAIEQQRAMFSDIARAWALRFPKSAYAMHALAVAQEAQGDLRASLVTLRSARALAMDNAGQGAALGATEVLLLIKLGAPDGVADLTRARALADTLLRSPAVADASSLAVVAAITGRADRAAQIMFGAARPETAAVDVIIPVAFTGPAAALLAYSAMGGPTDRIDEYERQLDRVLRNRLRASAMAARHPALDQAASLAFAHHPLAMSDELAADSVYPLLQAQVAFRRGDVNAARSILDRMRAVRGDARPAELPFDAVFPEAALRFALGDTASAASMLDATLGDINFTEPGALAHFESAASLVRAMVLRADIASSQKQQATASRWARAVTILWSGADPALARTLQRMQSLSPKGNR